MEKIVITGLGVISALGNDVDTFWQNMIAAKSGITEISRFNTDQYRTKIAAEVVSDMSEHIGYNLSKFSLNTQFAVACADELIRDAQIADGFLDKSRIGICLGTGLGGLYYSEEALTKLHADGASRINPMSVPYVDPNSIVNQIAIKWGFTGHQSTISTACSSSGNAIGLALDLVRSGRVDAVITGGVEATIFPLIVAGFDRLRAMSPDNQSPATACNPFSVSRNGFVLGEGAAMLFIEKESSARARGARIYAELAGYGSSGGAYHSVMPVPDGNDSKRSMTLALQDANLNAEDIDLINPHGTGTKLNDAAEFMAMKEVFGTCLDRIHVTPTKQLTGHLLGAAAAIEALHTVKSIYSGVVTPIIASQSEFDLKINAGALIKTEITSAISNSFGFGNNNASLVFRSFK